MKILPNKVHVQAMSWTEFFYQIELEQNPDVLKVIYEEDPHDLWMIGECYNDLIT